MGFLENAAEGLAYIVDSKADPWIDKGLTKLRTDVVPRLPTEGTALANTVIDKIDQNRGLLVNLSHSAVVTMTGYLAIGAEDEARVTYLREQATFDEAQDALKAATGAALKKNLDNAEEWKKTKALLLEILAAAGKAAIPILMAMI